jgi:carbonic anhydrase/acetyltransferase-like protein (isoleucine patch superfamily)
MAIIRSIRGITPVWGADCFLAETAVLIGDVVLGDGLQRVVRSRGSR